MTRFSISISLGDAFGLIRRRPISVLVWGGLVMAPVIVVWAAMVPALTSFYQMTGSPVPDQMLIEQMIQLQAGSMLANILQMGMLAIVYAAIMRAILWPGDTRAFSLRVGMDELRIAIVGFAIIVGFYAVTVVWIVLCVGLGMALWSLSQTVVAVMVVAMAAILVIGAIWGLARVSLIAPASLLFRDIAFVAGWKLARGQSAKLFGLLASVVGIILLVEVAAIALGAWLVFISGGLTDADGRAALAILDWVGRNPGWICLAVAVWVAIYGVVMTLAVAPFASACRQLADQTGAKPDGLLDSNR